MADNYSIEDLFGSGQTSPQGGFFLNLVGTGADLFMNYWGITEERKQQKMLLELEKEQQAQEYGMRQEYLGVSKEQLKLQKKRLAVEQKEAAKMWKWKEEEQGYQRARDVVNQFTGILDRGPAFKNNLVNLWPKYPMRRTA